MISSLKWDGKLEGVILSLTGAIRGSKVISSLFKEQNKEGKSSEAWNGAKLEGISSQA